MTGWRSTARSWSRTWAPTGAAGAHVATGARRPPSSRRMATWFRPAAPVGSATTLAKTNVPPARSAAATFTTRTGHGHADARRGAAGSDTSTTWIPRAPGVGSAVGEPGALAARRTCRPSGVNFTYQSSDVPER